MSPWGSVKQRGDQGQNPEPSTIGERIQRWLVGTLRDRHWRPGAECPFASATPADAAVLRDRGRRNFMWFMTSPLRRISTSRRG